MMTPPPRTPSPVVELAAANSRALSRLRQSWLVAALLYAASIAAGYVWLAGASFEIKAARWVLWASLAAATILALLWHILPLNRRKGETQLFANLGAGTQLSLVCGLLIAYLAGFLLSPMPAGWLAWAPALLYTVARLLDLLDGYLARRADHVTELGSILDIELDGLGLLVAVVLGVQWGRLPAWYLALAVSRQLFVAGMWLLKRRGKPVFDLPPSENRRIIAGFQTGFLTVMLWPVLPEQLTSFLAVLFAIPLIASFGRDWLVVSGTVNPDSPAYLRTRAAVKRLVEGWLPLVARLAGTALTVVLLWRAAPSFATWDAPLRSIGIMGLSAPIWTISALAVLALPFFALGIAGRMAAFFVMALAFLDISAAGLEWSDNVWILSSAVLVAHFGSGFFSLWRPEEAILHRRLGDTGPALR